MAACGIDLASCCIFFALFLHIRIYSYICTVYTVFLRIGLYFQTLKFKKMNYLKISVCVLLTCFIAACSDKNESVDEVIGGVLRPNTIGLTTPEYLSIAFGSDNELSEAETNDILNSFLSEQNNTRSTSCVVNLKNKTVIKGKSSATTRSSGENEDDIVFHEYEIKEENSETGFAIVCGDKRFPSVIVYSESDNSEIEAAKMMTEKARLNVLAYIAKIKYYEDSLRTKTLKKISEIENVRVSDLSVEEIENKIYIADAIETRGGKVNPAGTRMVEVGPFTFTKWDQVSPYNFLAPTTKGTSEEGFFHSSYRNRYPAGCVVIAMAQIATFFKPVTGIPGFNWTSASVSTLNVNDTTSNSSVMISSLISKIAVGSGTTYSAKGGSTNSENARNFMKSWGIYMDNATSCTFQNMKASLDALRLVYVTGVARDVFETKSFTGAGSHAWIIDGYSIYQRTISTRQILLQNNVYCHANFGWGGNSDGWYLYETNGTVTFDSDEVLYGFDDNYNSIYHHYVFDYNLKCYPNVRK